MGNWNSISLLPYEHTPENVGKVLNQLLQKDLIKESKEGDYKVSDKGVELYKNYCSELDEIIYGDSLDIALMKFLYDMGNKVPWVMLPYFITQKAPRLTRDSDIYFHAKSYFKDDSLHHDKFLSNDKIISLNKEGKRFFEYRIRKKEAEKREREANEKMRDLDIKEKIRNSNDYLSMKRQRNWLFVIAIVTILITIYKLFF